MAVAVAVGVTVASVVAAILKGSAVSHRTRGWLASLPASQPRANLDAARIASPILLAAQLSRLPGNGEI